MQLFLWDKFPAISWNNGQNDPLPPFQIDAYPMIRWVGLTEIISLCCKIVSLPEFIIIKRLETSLFLKKFNHSLTIFIPKTAIQNLIL